MGRTRSLGDEIRSGRIAGVQRIEGLVTIETAAEWRRQDGGSVVVVVV
jgi:hypothetical protein